MQSSGVARAFPGGRVAHTEGQIEEENEGKFRKNLRKWGRIEEMFLSCPPGREWEADYGPDAESRTSENNRVRICGRAGSGTEFTLI